MVSNEQFIETFREEALELLGTLEATLLELEEAPSDRELLSAVFRVMHTIKGSAAMFGLDCISSFAHDVETILSALRDGKISVSSELIGNTLVSRDMIREMLDKPEVASGPLTHDMVVFLESFRESVGFYPEGVKAEKVPSKEAREDAPLHTWYIIFKPGLESFLHGSNPLAVISELASMGELVSIPDFDRIPILSEFNYEQCLTSWHLFISTRATENQLRDVFIFVEDFSEISFECMTTVSDEETVSPKRLGEILVERGSVDREAIERVLKSQKKIGELLIEEKIVSPTNLRVALETQKQIQSVQKAKTVAMDMSTIRVKSDKLDQLMSLVGELVTIHARILQTTRDAGMNDEMLSVVEQFGRLTDELRNNTMSIRMVPIGSTFSTFKRLVRDLSSELGKQIELVTDGGDTELDKTVIEKLNDPLIHIIRNSLDHGIEQPADRLAHGKPETGTIRLIAEQTGASVHLVIEDDGKGLDTEAIRKKAVSQGLLKEDEVVPEQDLFKLIFAPGFSTKETVSAVSGRGVGMDVVNRQMELIGGSIAIDSKPYQYTRITLKIPLTLAIIDGLLVRIDRENFIVPLAVIVGCLEYMSEKQKNDHNIVIFQGRQLPFVNMRDFFGIPGARPAIEQMVIVTLKNQQFGLLFDQVIGGNQTVIKPLGKLFKRADGISSASVLGDGSVALILDAERIIEAAEKAEV